MCQLRLSCKAACRRETWRNHKQTKCRYGQWQHVAKQVSAAVNSAMQMYYGGDGILSSSCPGTAGGASALRHGTVLHVTSRQHDDQVGAAGVATPI